jgi:hypothetical protein
MIAARSMARCCAASRRTTALAAVPFFVGFRLEVLRTFCLTHNIMTANALGGDDVYHLPYVNLIAPRLPSW